MDTSLPIRVRASRVLVRAHRLAYTGLCEGGRKGDLGEHAVSKVFTRQNAAEDLTDSMTAPVVGS